MFDTSIKYNFSIKKLYEAYFLCKRLKSFSKNYQEKKSAKSNRILTSNFLEKQDFAKENYLETEVSLMTKWGLSTFFLVKIVPEDSISNN